MNALCFLAADPFLGKIDTASMPHQTLLELLISDFDDKSVFRDSDGFMEISLWEGVTTNEQGEVTGIEWERDYLLEEEQENANERNARLPQSGGSIDFKWLPATLTDLTIPYLELSGTIDTFGLPRGLTHIDVEENKLEGTFETSGLPDNVQFMYASENMLSGTVDFSRLPRSLKALFLAGNSFSGSVDFSALPETLENIKLSKNRFSGPMDLCVISKNLLFLRLEENQFDTVEVLKVRNGTIDNLSLDRGDIEAIVDTDENHLNFDIEEETFIHVMRLVE